MNKYQFLENERGEPVLIEYGQLGTCQLLSSKQSSQLYALKLAPKFEVEKDIQCLTRMNHPNIIKIIEHFEHNNSKVIVFEFMANGDLYTKIKCKQILACRVASIFRGICLAIQYIHDRKVIHRNLKSEAILLDQKMNPKIIDFGLAARLRTRKTFCGCFYYMAPQILMYEEYNYKADIWALGVILYEMVYGEVPFNGDNTVEILAAIKASKLYSHSAHEPDSVDDLIRKLLSYSPNDRPSFQTIFSHPYLVNAEKHAEKGLESSKRKKLLPYNSKYEHNKMRSTKNTRLISSNQNKQVQIETKRPSQSPQEHSPISQFFQQVGQYFDNKLTALFDREDYQSNPRFVYTSRIL